MNSQPLRWFIIIGAGFLVGLILLCGVILLFGQTLFRPMFHPLSSPLSQFLPGQFDSNGERIYFTGTSQSGQPIVPEMLEVHQMPPGRLACVNCHGPEGRGGTITMMMGTFHAPDIRYSTLTALEHDETGAEAHEEHPAYTNETIKRAITRGIDPAGEPLEWPMPDWQMSDSDLEDLVDYLKSLE
jgi:hypothetical protein